MSEWITDRLPTVEDTSKTYKSHVFGRVFVTRYNTVTTCLWSNVDIGEAWQPITVPEPYVKPKRWSVVWSDFRECWALRDYKSGATVCLRDDNMKVGLMKQTDEHRQAAERIAAIYEEVMP